MDTFQITVVIFAIPDDPQGRFILVCLEEDANEGAAAQAVARGFQFAGVLAVSNGTPTAHVEPGFEAVVAVAGGQFAEMLAVRLQRHQLARQASKA